MILFADIAFDPACREIKRAGELVRLHRLGLSLLGHLIQHRDRAVEKRELTRHVWAREVVSDAAISRAVSDVRRAIGDDGTQQKYIRTLHAFGYRFIAAVDER